MMVSREIPLSFLKLCQLMEMRGWNEGHSELVVSRDGLIAAFREILTDYVFNEDWYLKNYPDVAEAIDSGQLSSAKEHYYRFGYFEGRLPSLKGFDTQSYLKHNPDLAVHLGEDDGPGLRAHFLQYGYNEGRNFSD